MGGAGDSSPTPPRHLDPFCYRPDVDGLRALALVSVILFHMDPGWCPGGFLGVDIFFTISGFVVAGLRRGYCKIFGRIFCHFFGRENARFVLSWAMWAMSGGGRGVVLVWSDGAMSSGRDGSVGRGSRFV